MVVAERSDEEGWRGVAVCWWEVVKAARKMHQAKDDLGTPAQRRGEYVFAKAAMPFLHCLE